MIKTELFEGLFPIVCRASVTAALSLALVAPASSTAARAAAQKGKAPVHLNREAGKAGPNKRAKLGPHKAKAAKAAPDKAGAVLPPAELSPPTIATLAPERSEAASRVIAWVAAADDNGALPYMVIDKQTASLSLFDADGEFLGQTPVLLGVGVGDDSSPGVGGKSLADIGPAERTTPAGRFVAKFGRAFGGQHVLWVDYANSVALHAVITTNKKEHRVARLLSPTVDDNRISFGCINVGTSFYTKRVQPRFRKAGGVVYILPDTKSLDEVFPRLRLLPYMSAASPG